MLVPATAQAARQQANLLVESLMGHLVHKKPLLTFKYNDYGSLVSLSQEYNIGYLKGLKLINNVSLRGKLAVFLYRFLFRRHQATIHGWWPTILLIISQFITRAVRPRLKLH